jgi:uncharacterized protein YcfL
MKMFSKRILPVAACLSAVIALGACDSINTVENEERVNQPTALKDKRIITDHFLKDYAKIISVNQATLPGDILKIQVVLENTSWFDQTFIWKFEWFDASGMIVETPLSTWQSRHLEARERTEITTVAPSPQCKDFRLKLQESKEN